METLQYKRKIFEQLVFKVLKNIFLTFGDGSKGWRDAQKRITREAKKSEAFDGSFGFDDRWLKSWDSDLFLKIESYKKRFGPRGHGYWLWKPAIMMWADLLFPSHRIIYVDAGSHFNFDSNQWMKNFGDWLKLSTTEGALAWQLPHNRDQDWCKKELVNYLKPNNEHLSTGQVQSGFIIMSPIIPRRQFLNEWLNIMLEMDGQLVNDYLSVEQELNFTENRHDQSVFSLLWKKYNFPLVIDQSDPILNPKSPILAVRNNTGLTWGTSRTKINFYSRRNSLIDLFIKLINKIRKKFD
jgi:hypothetical protein